MIVGATPTIVVHITCERDAVPSVAASLTETLRSFQEQPNIAVSDSAGEPDRQLVSLTTTRPYTFEAAENLLSVPGYDAIMEIPGVHMVDVVSSDLEKEKRREDV